MKAQHTLAALVVFGILSAAPLRAQADYNDLQMAHVAVIADAIDIRYAHLALALSATPAIREFAETMIRDHTAITAGVAALAKKLNVEAQDNPFSKKLQLDATTIIDRLSKLRGAAFDRAYAQNDLEYHRAVNGLVGGTFIPRIQNAEVKQAFVGALVIFKGHERHAEMMVRDLDNGAK